MLQPSYYWTESVSNKPNLSNRKPANLLPTVYYEIVSVTKTIFKSICIQMCLCYSIYF